MVINPLYVHKTSAWHMLLQLISPHYAKYLKITIDENVSITFDLTRCLF